MKGKKAFQARGEIVTFTRFVIPDLRTYVTRDINHRLSRAKVAYRARRRMWGTPPWHVSTVYVTRVRAWIFLASIVSCRGPLERSNQGDDGGLCRLCWGFDTNALGMRGLFRVCSAWSGDYRVWCFRRFVSCGRERGFVCLLIYEGSSGKYSLVSRILKFYSTSTSNIHFEINHWKLLEFCLFEKRGKRLAYLQKDISLFIFPLWRSVHICCTVVHF